MKALSLYLHIMRMRLLCTDLCLGHKSQMSVVTREVLMGEGNGVASVIIMLTFTVRPGPHADTAWAVVG